MSQVPPHSASQAHLLSLGAPLGSAHAQAPAATAAGEGEYVHRPSISAPFNHPYSNPTPVDDAHAAPPAAGQAYAAPAPEHAHGDQGHQEQDGGYHAISSNDAATYTSPSRSTRSLVNHNAYPAPTSPRAAHPAAGAGAVGAAGAGAAALRINQGPETASGMNPEGAKAVDTHAAETAYAGAHGGDAGFGPGKLEGPGSNGLGPGAGSTTQGSNTSQSDSGMSEKKKLAAAGAGGAAAGAAAGAVGEKEATNGGPGAGAPGGPGGPGGRPKMDKYAYGFFDPQMAPFRKIVAKIIGGGTMILIILMWLCLPFYWGSLWETNVYTNHLSVRVIDRDQGEIGTTISQALLAPSLRPALGYFSSSASDWPTDEDVVNDLLEDNVWGAIVIQADATANLATARQNGLSSYNGSQVIQVYYSQARFENAVNAYLVPYMQMSLGMITGMYNAKSNAEYLGANAGNATAIGLLARAPQTMSQPVYFTMNNLRPYNQPVATAITLVGLIYMLIFAFILTMMNNAAREIISPFMTTKAYIAYRLILPLVLYLPLSLLFAMVSLPFGVHFDAHYTYAGGFFLWFFTLFLGMASVGLATEFAITVLGPQFTGFFLIPLIIANVCVASFPHELQPWIFRYGVAMPFYNVSRVVRTIIFNTKNDIAMNLGILLAWIVFSMITISLATWLLRRKAVNAHRHQASLTAAEKIEERDEDFHARRGLAEQEDVYDARTRED